MDNSLSPNTPQNFTPVNLDKLSKKKGKKPFFILTILLVLTLGVGVGLFLVSQQQIFKPKALECTNLEKGWHKSDETKYGWNGKSYLVPAGCRGYYYKCPGKNICPYLNNGCQLNQQVFSSGKRTTAINLNFCGVQQTDVNCDSDVSPESYHTYWNITDAACKPPTKTPTPTPTLTPTGTPTPSISPSPTITPPICPVPEKVTNLKVTCPTCQ